MRPFRALPGLGWREFRFPAMQKTASVEMPVFDDAKGCSDEVSFPTMQEAASVEMLAPDGAKGCSDEDFVSGGTGVGRSAPLHPLG